MKKRKLIGAIAVCFVLTAMLLFRFFYNEAVIRSYEGGNYGVSEDILLAGNFLQPYIACYNKGNLAMGNREYAGAVEAYKTALTKTMPQERECAVRINLALAILGLAGEGEKDRDATLELLCEARDVLLEKGCADEQGTGHSGEAETLKAEIEALIQSLEDGQEESFSDDENTEEEEEQEDSFEQDIKETMKEKQAEAVKQRNETMDFYEEFNKGYNFDQDGIIW